MAEHITGFQTKDGVKKYDFNALANRPTDATNTVISPNADYAEVGEWADGNPSAENRLGYFVAVAEVADNTTKIRKATSKDDVRGVTVYNPAFSGNAAANKYGASGELLKQYNYVGIMGIIPVIDNGRCTVQGRCMPADDGTAIPSTNNMGYAVLERVDATHVLIAVEPGADMAQRIKSDIRDIETQIERLAATPYDKAIVIELPTTAEGEVGTLTLPEGFTVDDWLKNPVRVVLMSDMDGLPVACTYEAFGITDPSDFSSAYAIYKGIFEIAGVGRLILKITVNLDLTFTRVLTAEQGGSSGGSSDNITFYFHGNAYTVPTGTTWSEVPNYYDFCHEDSSCMVCTEHGENICYEDGNDAMPENEVIDGYHYTSNCS